MPAKKSPKSMLASALRLAPGGDRTRRWRLGAVGVRADGVIVQARNGAAIGPTPAAHAEGRLAAKLTPGSVVFVARVLRKDGTAALAKPCKSCQALLKAAGVVRVYYTTAKGFAALDLT